jgi:hypothetical protein
MVYALRVPSSNTETDRLEYVIHDLGDVRSKCGAGHVQQDGFVAASNIESYAARTDGVFVRDYAADWNGVAFVMISHQRNLVGCLGARLDLTQCAFVGRSPHRNVFD